MKKLHLAAGKTDGVKHLTIIYSSALVLLFAVLTLYFSLRYQNHFYWKEQNQLFVLSADWLTTYFDKPAWAACLLGDFLTQAYYYTYAGPAILSLCLVITAWLTDLSIRKLVVKPWASVVALVVLVLLMFSMMDAYSQLSSLIAVAGGELSFLAASAIIEKVNNRIATLAVAIVSTVLSFWLFGLGCMITVALLALWCGIKRKQLLPTAASLLTAILCPLLAEEQYNMHFTDCITYPYLKAPKMPETAFERSLDISNSYYFGRYDYVVSKVPQLSQPSKVEQFYYYLVNAQRGTLADNLLTLNNPDLGTLNSIGEKTPVLIINMMNDLYYAVGDMTYTERAAMVANVFSPQNRNSRYIKRLAEANLISGDTVAAMKYLRLLSHTLLYRKWAADHTPATMSVRVSAEIEQKRKYRNSQDTLRIGDNCRTILTELLESNANNTVALDYLLCTDLLLKDIDNFKNDYDRYCISTGKPRIKPLYQQALMIWLAGTGASEGDWHKYIVDLSLLNRFKTYNENRGSVAFSDTYWYYFDTRK